MVEASFPDPEIEIQSIQTMPGDEGKIGSATSEAASR